MTYQPGDIVVRGFDCDINLTQIKAIFDRVIDALRARPEQLDMAKWFRCSELTSPGFPNPLQSCGTTACLAGWIATLQEPELKITNSFPAGNGYWQGTEANHEPVSRVAARSLGLSMLEADKLFYVSHWPREFATRYVHGNTVERVNVLAERLDYYLEHQQ